MCAQSFNVHVTVCMPVMMMMMVMQHRASRTYRDPLNVCFSFSMDATLDTKHKHYRKFTIDGCTFLAPFHRNDDALVYSMLIHSTISNELKLRCVSVILLLCKMPRSETHVNVTLQINKRVRKSRVGAIMHSRLSIENTFFFYFHCPAHDALLTHWLAEPKHFLLLEIIYVLDWSTVCQPVSTLSLSHSFLFPSQSRFNLSLGWISHRNGRD